MIHDHRPHPGRVGEPGPVEADLQGGAPGVGEESVGSTMGYRRLVGAGVESESVMKPCGVRSSLVIRSRSSPGRARTSAFGRRKHRSERL